MFVMSVFVNLYKSRQMVPQMHICDTECMQIACNNCTLSPVWAIIQRKRHVIHFQIIIVAFKKIGYWRFFCSQIWNCSIYTTASRCQNGISFLGLISLNIKVTVVWKDWRFSLSSVLNTLQPHWPYSLSALTLFQRLLTLLSAQFLGIQILLDVLLLPQSSLLPPQPSRSRFPKPYSQLPVLPAPSSLYNEVISDEIM